MLSRLSLYWPGLYTWLYWGTLWLCALWYLYDVSILTWSLHLTVLGYAVTMCSVISLCCLCFLYTDLVSTLDCVGVRCDYVLCDIFMLSLYWPGLYTWLCWGTLWLCALWYLYAAWSLPCVEGSGLLCLWPATISRLTSPEPLSSFLDVLLVSGCWSWTKHENITIVECSLM